MLRSVIECHPWEWCQEGVGARTAKGLAILGRMTGAHRVRHGGSVSQRRVIDAVKNGGREASPLTGRHCRRARVDKCDAEGVRHGCRPRGKRRGHSDGVGSRWDLCHGSPDTSASEKTPWSMLRLEITKGKQLITISCIVGITKVNVG